jgi:uncharacterized protein
MSTREFTAISFYEYLNEDKLMGSKCKKCGAIYLPPRPLCIACQNNEMEWLQLKGNAALVAFTTIFVGPSAMISEGFNRLNPYCTGIVKLEEGPKISARIIGVDSQKPDTIKIGTKAVVDFLHRSENNVTKTLLAFKLLSNS